MCFCVCWLFVSSLLASSIKIDILLFKIQIYYTVNQQIHPNYSATTPCSSRKLYDFCWYLFLCAKSEYPENSVDLVTTFNMLLCCVDLVFANIVADRRGDLVNANLYTDPQWNTDELLQAADAADAADAAHAMPRKRICTIGLLCKLYDGPVIDAMETKQYAWSGVLRRFCAEKVLRCSPPAAATATADGSNGSGGSAGEFLGLLTVENFDANLSALKNMYKRYFLSVGEIDEGILLTQVENSTMTHNLKRQTDESKKQLMPPTPLTRRYYLPGKDAGSQAAEPVDMATRSVQRLRGALGTYDPEPPASLAGLLAQCPDDPLPKMRALRNQMIAQFCVRFETNARERFELAEMLYYRLLENILRREQASRQSFDFKILRHDVFHATLLTCSVEIVIHAYMGQKRFPWVLECFAVEAYHFYKIIEMIVLNHGDILSRDVIKHLNAVGYWEGGVLSVMEYVKQKIYFRSKRSASIRWCGAALRPCGTKSNSATSCPSARTPTYRSPSSSPTTTSSRSSSTNTTTTSNRAAPWNGCCSHRSTWPSASTPRRPTVASTWPSNCSKLLPVRPSGPASCRRTAAAP